MNAFSNIIPKDEHENPRTIMPLNFKLENNTVNVFLNYSTALVNSETVYKPLNTLEES